MNKNIFVVIVLFLLSFMVNADEGFLKGDDMLVLSFKVSGSLFQVHWVNTTNPKHNGHGEPISKRDAEAAVELGNSEYPSIHHIALSVEAEAQFF